MAKLLGLSVRRTVFSKLYIVYLPKGTGHKRRVVYRYAGYLLNYRVQKMAGKKKPSEHNKFDNLV